MAEANSQRAIELAQKFSHQLEITRAAGKAPLDDPPSPLHPGLAATLAELYRGQRNLRKPMKQRLNAAGRYDPRIPDDTITLVRELARLMPEAKPAQP